MIVISKNMESIVLFILTEYIFQTNCRTCYACIIYMHKMFVRQPIIATCLSRFQLVDSILYIQGVMSKLFLSHQCSVFCTHYFAFCIFASVVTLFNKDSKCVFNNITVFSTPYTVSFRDVLQS